MLNKKILYLITDDSIKDFKLLLYNTECALNNGVSILQYRNKNDCSKILYEQAKQLRELCLKYKVKFIINDRLDIALSVDADGIHLGKDDLPINIARNILDKNKLIGATAKNVCQALQAERMGVDYLGVGALFTSPTKPNAIPVTLKILKDIKNSVKIPVYAIGGITPNNLNKEILDTIDGIAVVSSILQSKSPEKMTIKFIKKLN